MNEQKNVTISSFKKLLSDSINYKNNPLLLLFISIVSVPNLFVLLFGASAYEVFTFIFYILIYHGISGYIFYLLVSRHIPSELTIPSILVLGILYNILIFFLLSFLGFQKYAFLNIIPILYLFFKHTSDVANVPIFTYKQVFYSFLVGMFVLLVIFPPCTLILFATEINHHLTIQGATAASVLKNIFPFKNPLFPELPLYYNYGYHMEMAFCHSITSIPLETLCTRLYPFYLLFLLAYTIYFFTKSFFKDSWIIGLLALGSIFIVPSFSSASAVWFLNAVPISIYMVGSSIIGLLIFFIIVSLINGYVSSNNTLKITDYILFFFLTYIGVICRSSFLPTLGGGLFFYLLMTCFRQKKLLTAESKLVGIFCVISGFSFILSLITVFGLWSNHSATGFLTIVSQNTNFGSSEFKYIINQFIDSNIIVALTHILFLAGFLSIGFYYKIYKWFKLEINNLDLLLLGCSFSGIIIWNFTSAPGGSHYTFLHYAQISCMIWGASGTYLLFKDLRINNKFLSVLALCAIGFFLLKIYEINTWVKTFYLNKLSFLTSPNLYKDVPKEIIEKITQISNDNPDSILINILPGIHLSTSHVISMHIKTYSEAGLSYHTKSLIKDPEKLNKLSKLQIKFKEITVKKLFTQDDMDYFQSIFPHKQLFFILTELQDPLDVKLNGQVIANISGIKILKKSRVL